MSTSKTAQVTTIQDEALRKDTNLETEKEWIDFTVPIEALEARWLALASNLNIVTEHAARWWDEIHRCHSEPQRRYHTLEHLAELLSFLDSPFGEPIETHRRSLVELAIFFHDIVYDPKSATNEEDSADLYRRFAAEVGLPDSTSTTVSLWILWTKAHAAPAGTAEDALLFLDFDMAILSKPWKSYYLYAAQVRQEYEFIPEEVYRVKRPEYFRRQLSDTSHRFYLSKGLAHFEERARRNLARECELLNAGEIPRTSVIPSD